ncbi:MAG: nucleotidyl transferase AbiEii/AbiGii toxin family protein [Campylobacterota bacterium]
MLNPICSCKIDENNLFNIKIYYPATFKDKYLRNEILLEIGPLAVWMPYDSFEISPYVVDLFPNLFEQQTCKVNAILAKRTFWEKATILHQEANRGKDKKLPIRYSRHYYDLAMMAKSSVKDEALNDIDLLKQVVDFKLKFYPATWTRLEEAKPGTIKLTPSKIHINDLKKDYKAMENMIFDKKLTFEEILKTLKNLENEINTSDK